MNTKKTTKVLIIDSDNSTSRTFKRILQKSDMAAAVAKNKQESIKKINSNLFDVILISLETPDLDGIDLLIFAKEKMPNAAKIVSIGLPSLETSIKALELGANAVFSKPVAPEDLVDTIRRVVGKNQK